MGIAITAFTQGELMSNLNDLLERLAALGVVAKDLALLVLAICVLSLVI